ncbi:ribonucleoside-diphosphate reductase subunit alpha [Ralstonia pickettii]|uniref:ribonucleoside-diphosphate reductase subunit alpha n=1 Tax=Ralstonia pickettii TaxID=329 RepID=UPI00271559FA|nr:ribonucleoside-diphosphate reductase subunit alpha [Ralstonia pickettii]WKZ86269.1 ribonucleoside-diphosphate reductase subunit alpha [Ralstonia pickettii]
MQVIKRDGSSEPFDATKIDRLTEFATRGLKVDVAALKRETKLLIFDGMSTSDIFDAQVKAAAGRISVNEQDATFVAARFLLSRLYKDVTGGINYPTLHDYLAQAVAEKRVNPELMDGSFDLTTLNLMIRPERDLQFTYLGLQTVVDRYLIRRQEQAGVAVAPIIELPQHFFMRVAMGLALAEKQEMRTFWACQFYEVLSSFDFMSSTPTLFNSGTLHSQLSSCYLNTVADQIAAAPEEHPFASIYGTIQECALLSKFAGGIGTDWTRVRSEGDPIRSTNGKSSGIVPYIKVWNDTAVAVNQGGKRNGAFAAYLESWHPDLYAFLELKKNSGDDRRRAHDIFPANWIPDLLMERVEQGGMWSFFSPAEYPELHDLFGDAFKVRYETLEAQGKYRFQEPAIEVWKKMLGFLFETGHPWITFKDECNRRNPQQHVGVIHNSNLCTEITLNTSDDETAVCNLGSINLARHVDASHPSGLNVDKLQNTVTVAMRMLDNVIDINFYPSERARNSNLRHRPVGLGLMGYAEWLVAQGVAWESTQHLLKADRMMEMVSYLAISASVQLAHERGAYESFKGSLWDQGILPIDTARKIGTLLHGEAESTLDWDRLAALIAKHGMRNSNCMAIAPTATISNIVGTTPTIEPVFQREYEEGNLSGSFKVIDPCLKYGRPELCMESYDIDQTWLVKAAALRQKWIDQAQSLNLFAKEGTKGRQLSELYQLAWRLGCKTTYYLRSQSSDLAKQRAKSAKKAAASAVADAMEAEVNLCSIDNPDCESCQ